MLKNQKSNPTSVARKQQKNRENKGPMLIELTQGRH